MKIKLTLPIIISSLLIMISVVTFQQGRVSASDSSQEVSIGYFQEDIVENISIISLDENGDLPNGESSRPSISADGQFIAFQSEASLMLNDTNTITDVYRVSISPDSNTVELVSIFNGSVGNGNSTRPSISPDGLFIAFQSEATNLSDNDNNNEQDIFLHDLSEGAASTVRISKNPAGEDLTEPSSNPSISVDGLYVAYESKEPAQNVVSTIIDTNGQSDIFRYNRTNHNGNAPDTTTFISLDSTSSTFAANDGSSLPKINLNNSTETHIAFYSKATNLVSTPSTTNENSVYVKSNNMTTYVDDGKDATISQDGQTVGYITNDSCSKIKTAQKSGNAWILSGTPFVQDPDKAYESPVISPDGEWLALVEISSKDNCLNSPDGIEESSQVYVVNLENQDTYLVSKAIDGNNEPANSNSFNPDIAVENGKVFVTFESWSTDLVEGLTDSNGSSDIFLYELEVTEAPEEPTPIPTHTQTPTLTPTVPVTPSPTPTITPTIPPSPTPTMTPTPVISSNLYLPLIVGLPMNQIQNPNFDSTDGWQLNPNALGSKRTNQGAIDGFSGLLGDPGYQIGNVPIGYGEIKQTFSVSALATEFTFDYKVQSHDRMYGKNSGTLFDTFEVYLIEGANVDGGFITEELQQSICVSNGQENKLHIQDNIVVLCGGHNEEQATDNNDANVFESNPSITLPESFKGKKVTLIIRVYNRGDGFFNTWAYVDNFEIK